MNKNDNEPVRFSSGRKNFGKVKNEALPWRLFKDRFKQPTRTGERLRDYNKMPEKEQRDLKAVDGYWMRAQNQDGIRKRGSALPSDLISLDFDYATPDFFAKVQANEVIPGVEHFIQTSRRHTPESPRFRMVIFNAEPVPNDYYPAVSRIISKEIDPEMRHVDPVSFRPAQMMFMPTACADGEYVFKEFPGTKYGWREALEVFSTLFGDWRDIQNLPKCVGEAKLRASAEKAENPTEKDGPVGYFCREYDVPTAIEEFLSDIYTPVDMPSAKPRYTYLGGTTVNGAEVQDDGLFLYSHHGSDPASDQLVNAFDLVRLHLFGKKDEGFDEEDASPGTYPSWKSMLEWCEKDAGYNKSRMASRYDTEAMFDDLWDEDQIEIEETTAEAVTDQAIADLVGEVPKSVEDDIESDYPDVEAEQNPASAKPKPIGLDNQEGHIGINSDGLPFLKSKRRRAAKPPRDWVTQLEVNAKTGDIANSLPNLAMILKNDTRFRDAMAFNEFIQETVMILPVRHKLDFVESHTMPPESEIMGEEWSDRQDATIRTILEMENGPGKSGWGLAVTDRNLQAAVDIVAPQHRLHPIKECMKSFKHDGVSRVEELFIKYLGCEDNEYHREAARTFMIASVARVFEPGHKFDYAPVLVGGQGVRKSTFAESLAMGFFGELTADFSDDQKLVEQMQGNWIMELPELVSMARSEVEPAKAFLSARQTRVRLSYDRRAKTHKRQCVFIGTTNNKDFLKDDTGNRRFWPLLVSVSFIDTDDLKRNLAQLWAEAYEMYVAMREEFPMGSLPLYLRDPASIVYAFNLQHDSLRISDADVIAEQIAPYLDSAHTDDEFAGVNDGKVPEQKRREWTSVASLMSAIPEVPKKPQLIASALGKLGWHKAAKRRVDGYPNPIAVYVPGSEVIERWAEEDAPPDDLV